MKYLMIDKRGFVGNDVLFWAKNHRGYTTDIDKAHIFDEKEARKIDGGRSTDCAIPLDEVLSAKRNVVDFQHLDRKYFKFGYTYFAENNKKTEHEMEIKQLEQKLYKMERLFDDMEYAFSEYNYDPKEMMEKTKSEIKKIMRGKSPDLDQD